MADRGQDWRSILLGLASLASALFAFAIAGLMIIYSLPTRVRTDLSQNTPTTLQAIVIASGIIFSGAVFLPASYYSFQRLRGKNIPDAAPNLLKPWQGIILLLLWAGAALLAQLMVGNNIFKWFTPPLYLLAICTPVYFLIRLAGGGLNAGSRQRFWGIPAVTIALGTTLSIVAEGTMVIIGLAGVAVYLSLHPEQLSVFRQFTEQFFNTSNLDSALNIAEPWLNNPFVIALALFFFSGLTPVIEETAKSIATWSVFDHLDSPAQGFVIGALSGAGFGLVESLLASATPDSSWAATLMIRGGSTMMHILTASITGWGIAFFRSHKRISLMIGSYTLAVFLHSLWNAAVIMIVFGGLRMSSNGGPTDPVGLILVFFGVSVLVVLCLAIPLTLGFINRWLRKHLTLPPVKSAGESLGGIGQKPDEGLEGVQ